MSLSKSSVLHYWSSRYGINPRIGGRPVFTRNSAGLFTTQEGEVDTAIVNTPRFDWATLNLPNGQTERRKVLTLELARSNALVAPSDFSNAAWTKSTCAVTTGIADPAGGTSACTLTATAASGYAQQTLSAGSSIVRTNTVSLRRRTGTGQIQVINPQNTAWVNVTLTSDWQRFTIAGAAGTGRSGGIMIAVSGDAIDVWLFQNEDGPFATSGIAAGSGASRAADSLYWNFPPVPQAMMVYSRHIEQGTLLGAGTSMRLWQISSVTSGTPQLEIYSDGSDYHLQHFTTFGVNVVLAAASGVGDTVDLLAVTDPTGAVALYQSINGAAPTVVGPSGALAFSPAWSDTKFWLNSAGSIVPGANKFAEVKIVKYADMVGVTAADRMSELRSFELGPNGDVL
jgi:hypothetical protein